jgi:hypothetical protein
MSGIMPPPSAADQDGAARGMSGRDAARADQQQMSALIFDARRGDGRRSIDDPLG